ncbi:MAG: VWA domain-containing protein [Dehalococcoidia bacterium]|nr:VWA domain-containing protein [Dehalococcoidia bacterium]
MPENTGFTNNFPVGATGCAVEPGADRAEERGLSEYWRVNISNSEAVELANLLRALRKVAGHLGPNAGDIEYAGMSRGGGAAIVIDPARVMGRYPVPPAKVDLLIGTTVHEALHRIVWSDHVWKLLEPAAEAVGKMDMLRMQKLVHTGEDIYVDLVAARSVLGLYVEKVRAVAMEARGKKIRPGTPSIDELVYVWWAGRGGGNEAYREALIELERLTDALRLITAESGGVTARCRQRADLYLETYRKLASRVSGFRVIDKQLYWYPSSVAGKEKTAPSPRKTADNKPLSPYLSRQIELQLAAHSADITPIIEHIVGPGADVAPTSRWDFNIPAHPVIDRRLAGRLRAIFLNYSERKKVVSRGLISGKVDGRRLYRAPISGRCFEQVDRLPDLDWTVTLLLDASGSMKGTKWRMVENTVGNLHAALAGYRNRLRAYAYFEMDGVCMFSSLLKGRRLFSIPPGGQTASGQAIIAAAYFMPGGHGRKLLIHITDGESNFGCDVQYGIDYCRQKNINLVTLACGYRDRAALTTQYGKTVQFLRSYGQLPQAIEDLLKWTFVYGRKPHLWKDSYLRCSDSGLPATGSG